MYRAPGGTDWEGLPFRGFLRLVWGFALSGQYRHAVKLLISPAKSSQRDVLGQAPISTSESFRYGPPGEKKQAAYPTRELAAHRLLAGLRDLPGTPEIPPLCRVGVPRTGSSFCPPSLSCGTFGPTKGTCLATRPLVSPTTSSSPTRPTPRFCGGCTRRASPPVVQRGCDHHQANLS